MISRMLFGCGVLAIFFCSAANCVAQPNEVKAEVYFGQFWPTPPTSIAEIKKSLITTRIESKDFQGKLMLSEFAEKLSLAISKKGNRVQIEIDHEAFQGDNRKEYIADEKLELPPVPSKVSASFALRVALSQVGEGKATYWFRRGQVVITSAERARSAHFLKTTLVEADVKNRPLTDVLDHLAEQSGVSIIIDVRVSNKARTTVTAKVNGKLETVVRLLTEAAGLKHVVAGNMIYVTSPANADRFAEISSGPMDGAIAIDELRCRNQPLLEAVGV